MNTPSFRHAAVAAVVVAASTGAALDAQAAQPAGAVLFTRSQNTADNAPRNRSLWMLDVATGKARPLTTATDKVFDAGASWSPDGAALVFDRGATRGRTETHSLQVLSGDGGRPKALVHGQVDASKPAWGPNNRIAYIAKGSAGTCVAIVDGNGRNGKSVLCSTAEGAEFQRPQWSADGKGLFVAGGYPEGRLEPVWHAQAYRIDIATGRATLLSDIVMEYALELTFSPDGTRGVYADIVASDMVLVDFRTGATTTLPERGYKPMFSRNGQRIAFTGEVYETEGAFRYYEPLFVMRANGTGLRRITDARVANHAYTAAQWSKDNVHLLVNRRTYAVADTALEKPQFSLRIVNADTKAVKQLPDGYAEAGAWFER